MSTLITQNRISVQIIITFIIMQVRLSSERCIKLLEQLKHNQRILNHPGKIVLFLVLLVILFLLHEID